MKTAAFTIFLLLFLAQNPAKKPDRSDTQGQTQADSPRETPVTVNCNQSTGTVADNNRKEAPERDTAVQWSNWALVIVAGITGYVIWIQAKETAKATKAANLMAISTLRPKLVIRGIALVPGILVPVADGTHVVEDAMIWQLECLIANTGGSVAHVTESNLTVATIGNAGDTLPVFPPYGISLNWLDNCDISPGEHKQTMVQLGESI